MLALGTWDDKVVVVTGAGSGIGRGIARAAARRGATVCVTDVDGERAAAVAAELRADGATAVESTCDVSSDAAVDALREDVHHGCGPVDVVVSNVGVITMGRPEDLGADAWRRLLDVNLLGAIRLTTAFMPDLLERGSGHLVFTASTAGLYPYAFDRLPYAASKAATIAYAEGLALYLAPRGIGVTCLCPGPVTTNIAEQVTVVGDLAGSPRGPALAPVDPDDVGELVAGAVEQGRFLLQTHPDEVRATMMALADDPDGFMRRQLVEMAAAS
ncbi:MAG: SDR family oxidoreductase [Ilumatobacteraceae bacterium]